MSDTEVNIISDDLLEPTENNHIDQILPNPPNKIENNIQIQVTTDLDVNCPICFEPWTNIGEHRICTLKCGHLFGRR
ncbi:hypothetical protein HZS_5074 [Henneguya salminicola]|nr:hypothetical protein HZS_5074 [Henneguya salminicola]